jgi:hypothetical protein
MPTDAEMSDHLAAIHRTATRDLGSQSTPNEQVFDAAPLAKSAVDTRAGMPPSNFASQITQNDVGPQPELTADRGWSSEAWIAQLILASIGIVLATSLLVLLLLFVVLRRLSWNPNSTIRIALADPDSASLRVLANRLALIGDGNGAGQECFAPTRSAGPNLSAPVRQTTVVELATAPFSAALTGPTFAEVKQAEDKRRLEQEGEILRSIYDHNLQLVAGLGKLRAKPPASTEAVKTRCVRTEPVSTDQLKVR